MDEDVDILAPPFFDISGKTKTRAQAIADGDWFGTFNLWVFARDPEPSILYQQRSLNKNWAPGLLDVAAGGHYMAGEKLTDGLREVQEELGKDYSSEAIIRLGRKVYVGRDSKGRTHNNIVEVYAIEDNSALDSFTQQVEEVNGICLCPIKDLLQVHTSHDYTFEVDLVTNDKTKQKLVVTRSLFPENWDNYHYKMAILADRYFKGERNLVY